MAARSALRALPTLFVGVLVLAAAAAQSGPANPFRRLMPERGGAFTAAARGAKPGPDREASPAAVTGMTCETVHPVAISVRPAPDARVWQPDAITSTASIVHFGVHAASGVQIAFSTEIAFFEPGLSDPRLGAYPLHRATLMAEGSGAEWLALPLDRPIVVRELDPASGVTWTAALAYRPDGPDPLDDLYDPNGPAHLRAALYEAGAIGFVPLPGPHAVLSREVCGDAYLNDDGLAVVRQVVRSDVVVTPTADIVQTFTCPITVTADWVELAIASPPGAGTPLAIELFDLEGALAPPPGFPATNTATLLDGAALAPPVWGASAAITVTARLEAGRRYGLRVVCDGQWSLGAAQSPGGSEYLDGELFTRAAPGVPFAQEPDLDLSFRLIGRPATGTALPPPLCDAPALSIGPTGTATFPVPPDRVVVQPLTIRGTDFGPDLKTAIGGVSWWGGPAPTGTATVDLVLAPPGSPPDPHAVALHRFSGQSRCEGCGDPWLAGVAPAAGIVHRTVTGVAQGGNEELALRWSGPATWTATLGYHDASPVTLPPALSRDGDGPWLPLPGANPVIAHVVCPITQTADPELYVAQQLVRADLFHGVTQTAELLQSFRVPVPTEVHWSELALRDNAGVTFTAMPGRIMAPGPCTCTADPDDGIPIASMAWDPPDDPSPMTLPATWPSFARASAFGSPITLTPGVDYWIHVTTTAGWDLGAADASPYTDGRLHRRASPGAPFVEETDQDLAFRLIGVPRALMAGPITHTCNGCEEAGFTAVTVTADVRGGGGGVGGLLRYAQGVTLTGTFAPGSLHLPLGADGGAVTITVAVGFAEPGPGGLAVPSSGTYPLHVSTLTASAGDMHWAMTGFDRPLVLRSWLSPTPTADPPLFVTLDAITPTAELSGRPKVALGARSATGTATPVIKGTALGWEEVAGYTMGHVVRPTTVPADPNWMEMVAVRDVHGVTITAQELVQTFRVPAACRVDWIELAVPEGQSPAPPFAVSIVDPLGLPSPPSAFAPTGTAVPFPHRASMALGSTWAATEPLGGSVVLVPGRDYWLHANVPAEWRVARGVTGTAQTGPLYTRPKGGGTWTQTEGPFAFRLIGAPLTPVAAPVAPRPPGLALSAEPQPFTRELVLRWSGGGGRMGVEIFDATGRRVRQVRDAGAALAGSWTWRGEDDLGRTVRAGVYFARVTPTHGPVMRRRVVFLR